jgi:hypothetical protein
VIEPSRLSTVEPLNQVIEKTPRHGDLKTENDEHREGGQHASQPLRFAHDCPRACARPGEHREHHLTPEPRSRPARTLLDEIADKRLVAPEQLVK